MLLHHEALLKLVPPLLLLPRHPAVRPAVPLAEPALRPALLAVFSDQRLQLLPGQLLLLRQDRPGLAVEMLMRCLGRGEWLLHVSHCLLQTRPVLLHPGAVPVLPVVRLFTDNSSLLIY